jgi:hypothetical protein
VCLAIGTLTRGPMGSAFLVLGFFFGPLLLQDAARFAFFAKGAGHQAFFNDVVWGALLFPSLVFVTRWSSPSVTSLVLIWAASGMGAAIFGMVQTKVLPNPKAAVHWIRLQRDLVGRFLTEFGVSSGGNQLALYLIGAIAGLSQLGILRAGLLLLGPLNILFSGAGLVAVPEGVRLLQRSPVALRRVSAVISMTLAAAAILWGLVVAAIPDRMGAELLGANWVGARSLVLPLSIALAAAGFVLGYATAVRALAAAGVSLRARSIDALLQLSGAMAGSLLAGASGAAWGAALAGCLRVPNWWLHARAAFRSHDRRAIQDSAASARDS